MSAKNKYRNNFKRKHAVALAKRFMNNENSNDSLWINIEKMLIRVLHCTDPFWNEWNMFWMYKDMA